MRSDRSTFETRIALLKAENENLKAENEKLRAAAADLHWMSRRYASGRMTYAVGMHNDATRTLLELGVKLSPTGDGTLWAMDGMQTCNEMENAYFEPGHPLATGAVLGLLPNHRLSQSLEAVLGTDPLRAVLRYEAAARAVAAVREDWEEIQCRLPSLARRLRGPLDALDAAADPKLRGRESGSPGAGKTEP